MFIWGIRFSVPNESNQIKFCQVNGLQCKNDGMRDAKEDIRGRNLKKIGRPKLGWQDGFSSETTNLLVICNWKAAAQNKCSWKKLCSRG